MRVSPWVANLRMVKSSGELEVLYFLASLGFYFLSFLGIFGEILFRSIFNLLSDSFGILWDWPFFIKSNNFVFIEVRHKEVETWNVLERSDKFGGILSFFLLVVGRLLFISFSILLLLGSTQCFPFLRSFFQPIWSWHTLTCKLLFQKDSIRVVRPYWRSFNQIVEFLYSISLCGREEVVQSRAKMQHKLI